jgi:hypothetical protein
MLLPNFEQLLSRVSSKATRSALRRVSAEPDAGAGRVSVAISNETRYFLEAQATAIGASIAGLAGSILDAIASQEFQHVTQTPGERCVSNFHTLLQAHGLSFAAAAEVLRELNITAGDMTSTTSLLNRLTPENLDWIAAHFGVSYEWLAGLSSSPIKVIHGARERGVSRVTLCLIRVRGDDFADPRSKQEEPNKGAFYPVVRVIRLAGPREEYETYEVWERGEWSYWRCREHIKQVLYSICKLRSSSMHKVDSHGFAIDRDSFSALESGRATLVSILSNARRENWHPDDFVEAGATAKDMEEWHSILKSPDSAWFFKELNELIASESSR